MFDVASDGSKTANNQHQIISIFKEVNDIMIDPLANLLVKQQTCNACWHDRIVLGREKEAMCANHIDPVYNWWDNCDYANKNDKRRNDICLNVKPFIVYYSNDISTGCKL